MRQLPIHDVGEDLGVPVVVRPEAGVALHQVVVDHAQRPKVGVLQQVLGSMSASRKSCRCSSLAMVWGAGATPPG